MQRADHMIQTAHVVANRRLRRDHYCLTLRAPVFPPARAGQFVHLCPERRLDDSPTESHDRWVSELDQPMLRRAFSIAGLRRTNTGVEVDVIYRVVGTATRWMESLRVGNPVSLLGPMGNSFPISERKPVAWLVAGGVGLPPMLWLAAVLHETNKSASENPLTLPSHSGGGEGLRTHSKSVVAFCGAQTHDLLALTLDPSAQPDRSAKIATLSAKEFTECGASMVMSTDDGSLGFHGYVGSAMAAYHHANPLPLDELVVYTCGPEAMMRFVAEYCVARRIECYVCVERNMACGTGMCQSCVVPVRDTADPTGWSYRLCCTDGPIFEARTILWETPK